MRGHLINVHRGNAARTGVVDATGLPSFRKVRWRHRMLDEGFGGPVRHGDLVIIGAQDGMHALDFTTGEEVWANRLHEMVQSPLLVDDVLYCPCRLPGFVAAVRVTDGSTVWRFAPETKTEDSDFEASPVLAEEVLCVSRNDGTVFGLEPTTGEAVWERRVGRSAWGAPAYVDGVLVVLSRDGIVAAIAPESGRIIWWTGLDELEGFSANFDTTATPAVADGSVFVAAGLGANAALACLDLSSGALRWLFRPPPVRRPGFKAATSPTVARDSVYYAHADGTLYRVDASNGEAIWRSKVEAWMVPEKYGVENEADVDAFGVNTRGILFVGDQLYLSRDSIGLTVLDAASAKLAWHWPCEENVDSPLIGDGWVAIRNCGFLSNRKVFSDLHLLT